MPAMVQPGACDGAAIAANFSALPAMAAQAQPAQEKQPDWGRVLTDLALDDRQLHYLLLLRERHLDRLHSLAAARQALSLQVWRRLTQQPVQPLSRGGHEALRACMLSA